jgi:hypothetical protein
VEDALIVAVLQADKQKEEGTPIEEYNKCLQQNCRHLNTSMLKEEVVVSYSIQHQFY